MRTARLALVTALLLLGTPYVAEAAAKRCQPIRDAQELDGSRYEGSDIYRIRATNTSCKTARRVARRSTLKGLRQGAFVLDYKWRRWTIHRNLAGSTDSYDARVPTTRKHVTWLFGDL